MVIMKPNRWYAYAAEYAFEAGTWKISSQLVDDGEKVLIPGVVFGKGF